MRGRRRVVLMVIDGLRPDRIHPARMPELAAHLEGARCYPHHRAVFPSATRVNSASLATGCLPARHGLAGNNVVLREEGSLRAVSAGSAEFVERWRRAGGSPLEAPALATLLASRGRGRGAAIFSNSSPGAAHMQDPRGDAWFFHRSGCWAPGEGGEQEGGGAAPPHSARGGRPLAPERRLQASYDGAGDRETTRRFVQALLTDDPAADLWLLWVCEPDHSQHAMELGSPEHGAVLEGADACFGRVRRAVEVLRRRGEEVLFIVCSDHGHETTEGVVDVEAALAEAGLLEGIPAGEVGVASSGMSFLVYLGEEAREREGAIAAWLEEQPWCDAPVAASELGLPGTGELALAVPMAKVEGTNRFGVPGRGWVARCPFTPTDGPGRGQHGGLGRWECAPLLCLSLPGLERGADPRPSATVDIAPTVLAFLDPERYRTMAGAGAFDGRSLLEG